MAVNSSEPRLSDTDVSLMNRFVVQTRSLGRESRFVFQKKVRLILGGSVAPHAGPSSDVRTVSAPAPIATVRDRPEASSHSAARRLVSRRALDRQIIGALPALSRARYGRAGTMAVS
jgi:hypothetical protein